MRDVKYSRYGGLADRRLKATGFFRTEHVDGRWWLVDPDGCLFISVGLCSVNLSCFDGPGDYGDEVRWAEATADLLREHGFNTLGRWSAARRFRALEKPMAYCTSLGFMDAYKNNRPQANGARGFPHETMPVFDAEWPDFCRQYARRVASTKDDPWLLGHFSDNELPFRPDALDNYLDLPESDPGHRAAVRFLASRGKTPSDATRADNDAFCTLVAERYYTAVAVAIRDHDPNHLYLGSRIHGRCICPATFRGTGAVDLVSVNYYHRWSPEPDRIAKWVRLSGRPVLVSEWYAMAPDEGEEVSGAGFRVRTRRDRGLFYQHFALGLLEHPGCVGWHWFKYGSRAKGIVTETFEPRRTMLDLMKALNRQVYPLALFFRDEPPFHEGSTTVVVLPDTQRYAQKYPENFEAQTRWIAENHEKRNIAYVVHLGDITQSDIPREWEVARRCFRMLDGQVPYALVPGNHDYHWVGEGEVSREARRVRCKTRLNEYFHVANMRQWPTFGGIFEEGRLDNSYHLARIGDRDWIILALEYGPRDEVLRWANGVLAKYPDRLGMLITHAYLFRNNQRYDKYRGRMRASPHTWGNDGEEMWNKLVRQHPNIRIVISGHVRTGGPTGSYLASEGDYGNIVHQMMTDYQKLRGGGQAYLRLLEFLPDGKTVQVRTYSPALDRCRQSPLEEFRFELQGPTRKEPRPVSGVPAVPLARPPTHRYRFDGKGPAVEDAAGDADGLLQNGAARNGRGQVVLTDKAYVALPPKVLDGLRDVTFEVWFTPTAEQYKWDDVVHFGEEGDYLVYRFRTPTCHRAEISLRGHNEDIQRLVPFECGTPMHVVVTYDHDATDGMPLLSYYRNGERYGTLRTDLKLTDVTNTDNRVGPFEGTVDELRVYAYPLSAREVANNFNAGPDTVVTKE